MITRTENSELCRFANLTVSGILKAKAEFVEIYQINFDDHIQVSSVFKAGDFFALSAILNRMIETFNGFIDCDDEIKVKAVSYVLSMHNRKMHLDFRLE